MLQYIHHTFFYAHIIAGSIAMIVFWLPMIAKKGDKNHKKYGKIFVQGMYFVSVSGFLMTSLVLIDPIGVRVPERNLGMEEAYNLAYQNRVFAAFLFMLSILVFSSVRQSIMVLRAKANRELLRTPLHTGMFVFMGLVGLIVALIGFKEEILLLQIFSALVVFSSVTGLHYNYKKTVKQREWLIAHLGNIMGAGIGAYTAFFAFGGSRLFSEFLTGSLQVIPWVIPGVIGSIAISTLSKKYREQYRVA